MKNFNLKEQYEKKKRAIKHLLDSGKSDLNDKIATVKATNKVDKKRFQSAFNTLLKK